MEVDLETQVCMLQSHMDGMIECAQKNGKMLKRFQGLEMRLLSLNSLRELIEQIHDDAKLVFNLESMSLALADFVTFKLKLGRSPRILLGEANEILPKEFWPANKAMPQTVAFIPL